MFVFGKVEMPFKRLKKKKANDKFARPEESCDQLTENETTTSKMTKTTKTMKTMKTTAAVATKTTKTTEKEKLDKMPAAKPVNCTFTHPFLIYSSVDSCATKRHHSPILLADLWPLIFSTILNCCWV